MTELVCRECDTYYYIGEGECPDCGSHNAAVVDE